MRMSLLKLNTASFARRPSGTDNIHMIYAESFRDEDHVPKILSEAHQIVNQTLDHCGGRP